MEKQQAEKVRKKPGGKLFYMMGKSAAGKDTLYREILKRRPVLKTCILYTTRPPREGEQDGITYHFTNKEELAAFEQQGKLIEQRVYETAHGPWIYATVDDGQLNLHNGCFLMQGTLESFCMLRSYFGADAVIPLYIETDDLTRIRRAIEREGCEKKPDIAEVCRRFLADNSDFSEDKLQAAGIEKRYCNDNMEDCLHEILQEIDRFLCGSTHETITGERKSSHGRI